MACHPGVGSADWLNSERSRPSRKEGSRGLHGSELPDVGLKEPVAARPLPVQRAVTVPTHTQIRIDELGVTVMQESGRNLFAFVLDSPLLVVQEPWTGWTITPLVGR